MKISRIPRGFLNALLIGVLVFGVCTLSVALRGRGLPKLKPRPTYTVRVYSGGRCVNEFHTFHYGMEYSRTHFTDLNGKPVVIVGDCVVTSDQP